MLEYYRNVLNVYIGLEKIGKEYEGHSKTHYFDNLLFYENAVTGSSTKRLSNFPKIVLDSVGFKGKVKNLELNKQRLYTYSTLDNAGATFHSWGKIKAVK